MHVIARLLAGQGGAVGRSQLLRLGFDDNAIAAQLAASRWQPSHDGVYLTFTGPPPEQAVRWAALLACSAGAVLSHHSAAGVYGFADARRPSQLVHVMIPEQRREVSPRGVRVHRSRLLPRIAAVSQGYPITTAADTVLDLAGVTRSADVVVALITRACRSGATTVVDILAALAQRKRQRHRWLIKAVCVDVRDGIESNLEHEYVHRVERAHGLPRGRRQKKARAQAGRIRRDVEYEAYRTVVELDGRQGHEGEGQHRDAARDNDTTEGRLWTLRYGHAPVYGTPCEVARQVSVVLSNNGWGGPLTACSPCCTAMRKI